MRDPAPKTVELARDAIAGFSPSNGSATAKRFQKLFADSKKHPVYWLEGLDIEYGERLIKLKDALKRTAHYNYEKQQHIKGKIQATRLCLRDVRTAAKACCELPNDQAQARRTGGVDCK